MQIGEGRDREAGNMAGGCQIRGKKIGERGRGRQRIWGTCADRKTEIPGDRQR
jgi:hypothetical protein